MATSTSFFGQRRGSTKSHTYQVYRGKQVTKDRVTKVANPQSDKQMKQRIRLTAVASFAAYLKQILDHSFQGIAYGQPSLSEFRRLNLSNANDLDQVSFPPKDVNDPGIANFQISKGSLLGVSYVFADEQKISLRQNPGKITGPNDAGGEIAKTASNANAIAKMLGVSVGDQVTFILQLCCADWEKTFGDGSGSYFPSQFIISRLITDVNDDEYMKGWNVDVDGATISNGLISIYYGDTDSLPALHLIGSDGEDHPSATGIDSKLPNSWDAASIYIAAYGAIVSRKVNGVYQRSQEFMWINDNKKLKDLWTVYNAAEKTYLKDNAKSDKYLNGGTEVVIQTM